MKPLALLALVLCGCGDDGSSKEFVGQYDVMISAMGKSDPDLVSVSEGRSGTLVLNFNTGITSSSGAFGGLRADRDGQSLSIGSQSVRVEHSTGGLQGTITGSGSIDSSTGGKLHLMLHFVSGGTTNDYVVDGARDL